MRSLIICMTTAASMLLTANIEANARALTSQVTELDHIFRVRPEYPVPDDPNILFYIERSVNSNTVVYAAHFDSNGHVDWNSPVDAYWRWYNVDGHRKPLNFIERMMAYGVKAVVHGPDGTTTFKVAALPERKLVLDLDSHGHPEALMRFAGRWVKLVYVYLQVDDSGFLPDVTSMDIFGTDKITGAALREHVVPR
ncbi:MAG: DUF4833 domain-containing protein [Alphaproteobacteria bacterium]|nr:DUF4833 domain-containing protein [Alphaproteobacteria bacterium]MDE2492751.1 DUF4833 domain-containing protein [Alphaproteobacteria bacterium]